MKLIYYTDEQNFGDGLNKLIFNHYIPELLDDNEEEVIMGIGTLLGLLFPKPETKKIYVFSSGFGYGKMPEIDNRYEFICVRGPLTAKKLNISKDFAITDGAILLKGIEFNTPEKEYKWSYIPHWQSERLFDRWKEVVTKSGGNYISPRQEPEKVIQEILKSEIILAEAMHGAIVADVLRVPWIPVKAYKNINNFKWQDWTESLNMKYIPVILPSLYSQQSIEYLLAKQKKVPLNSAILKPLSFLYYQFQKILYELAISKKFKQILNSKKNLSDSNVLEERYQKMKSKLEKLGKVKTDFS